MTLCATTVLARVALCRTVSGTGFGLLDPLTQVAVGFGNPGDGSLVGPLPIVASYPSQSDVLTPGFSWVPGAQQWVKFGLPRGLGANRSVRIVPYHVSSGVTQADILRVPTSGSVRDTFAFQPPFVS
jgi:hypothetical protein